MQAHLSEVEPLTCEGVLRHDRGWVSAGELEVQQKWREMLHLSCHLCWAAVTVLVFERRGTICVEWSRPYSEEV